MRGSDATGARRHTTLLLLLLMALALGLRHLHLFYTETNILHLEPLADAFLRITLGQGWFSTGQELGESRVTFGGPMYTWLSYPALLLSRNPVTGLHLCYYMLELAGLAVWMLWPSGGTLRREVRWLGAAMLVLYPEAKVELVENATIMAYLLPPVLITFLWSTRARSWRSAALPGALLAVAVQVHAMAAVLAPALLLALAYQRELFARRTLALCAGAAVTALISIQAESYSVGQGGDIMRYIWDHFSSPRMALGLLHLVKDPLALLGAGLALVAWRRGERLPVATVLALAWVVLGVLGASVVYAREVTIFFPFMPRFALINAGRVVLAGAGALWLLAALDRRWPAGWRVRPGPATAVLVVLAVAAAYMIPGMIRGRTRLNTEYDRVSASPCLCELLDSHNLSRFRKRSFDDLLELPPALDAPVAVEPYDRLGREVATAQVWQPAAGGAWPPTMPSVGTVAVAPWSPHLDLASVPGARRIGLLAALPGCAPVDPSVLTRQGQLTLTSGQRRPSDRLLVLFFSRRQRRDYRLEMTVDTKAGARRMVPRELCQCRGGHSFVGGWYLFDLRGQPGALSAFRLRAAGRPGEDWKAQAHFLPATRHK